MVSTHIKNISQIGSFPQVRVKIKDIWNHHLFVRFLLVEFGYAEKTSPLRIAEKPIPKRQPNMDWILPKPRFHMFSPVDNEG